MLAFSLLPILAVAQVTLRIDAVPLTFNKLQFRYDPYPLPVTVAVK